MGRPPKVAVKPAVKNADFVFPVEGDEESVAAVEAALNAVAPDIVRVRRERQPLNGRSLKLQVFGTIPGYHLYIAKDEAARVPMMQQAGYDFVARSEVAVGTTVASNNTDPGDKVRFILGSNGSEPVYGYLMKIPEEFWLEDQQALEAANAEIDNMIRGGRAKEMPNEQRYIPKGGIQYDPKSPKIYLTPKS